MKTLTPAERKIVCRLKRRMKYAGCYGEMMKMAFKTQKGAVVRQLLADIKLQAYHAPDSTAKMIGFKTFLMIIKL